MRGIIYTETVIHAAPQAFVAGAPYQIAIVELEDGRRIPARIVGPRVAIGDRVALRQERDGVYFFEREL